MKLWNISYCAASYGSHYCFVPNGIITTCIRAAGNKRYMIGSFDENNVTIDKDKLSEWKNRSPFEIEKCKDCKFICYVVEDVQNVPLQLMVTLIVVYAMISRKR